MNKDVVAEMSQQYQVEAAEKVVPEGYKQTEVGVIPEDWEVKSLGTLVDIRSGESPSKFTFQSAGIPYFKVEQLNNDSVYADETPYFIENVKFIPAGSVIFPKRGASILLNKIRVLKKNSFMDTNLMTLTCHEQLDEIYLYNQLTYKGLDSVADTTSIPQINNKHIIPYLIPFPTKEEQFVIANALSDTDALLSELEKLIAKKQAIKTATMQQLLTGRTRLPQFAHHPDGSKKGYKQSELGEIPEDWEAKSFGDLFESSITRKRINPSEVVSFVGMQDVSESAQLVNQSQIQYSTVKSGFTYFEKDDVLVAKITPCFENGKGCHAVNLKTDIGFGSTEFHVLRAKSLADSRFIYYWTTRESFRAELETEMVGSAGHRRVPLAALQDYLIPCPSDKQEQTAIATILADMDSEIQALEQRLIKTRQIKQGMMQELLTGKIRLVKPINEESEHD